MAESDVALMAHLMRRAGFGVSLDELETRAANGYGNTVEELLHPEKQPDVDIYDLIRYQPWTWKPGTLFGMGHASWTYRLLNTESPLQEKMALFWHCIFATGVSKVDHWDEIVDMVDMLREKGLGPFREILVEVAKNPAMIYWLDNNENHADRVNENWGPGGCWSSSPWASGTTRRPTCASARALSPGGRWSPSCPASRWAASTGFSSTGPTTTTTAKSPSLATQAT